VDESFAKPSAPIIRVRRSRESEMIGKDSMLKTYAEEWNRSTEYFLCDHDLQDYGITMRIRMEYVGTLY